MSLSHPGVVVVGSSNLDLVAQVERAPGPGETVLCETYFTAPGGKGANQAVAAARMGAPVVFIACVGDDAAGAATRAGCERDGIDVRHVVMIPDAPTGAAFIWVDRSGENRIVVASGANRRLSPAHVDSAAADFAQAAVVLCQLETPLPTVRRALERGREAGARVILNPAPAAALDRELLSLVDILTPNESEAARLLGLPEAQTETPEELAERLLIAGAGAIVLTRGERGVLVLASSGSPVHIPAPPIDVVDTTGAGDVFSGALAAFLAGGADLVTAARLAVTAASLACTRPGAQPSIPPLEEVTRTDERG
ncbi:MAG TPA: ribokinase [Armatimonadota bacterium]|nr:ribokinase [Armatimonadota bacterium]